MPQKLIGNFINTVTKKYFCFNGRAGRAEFWLFFLAVFIVNTILGFVPKIGGILGLVWALGMLLPTLGVTARRLHDRNKSGWMILVSLIPLIGTLILLIMCIPEGDKEQNRFGEVSEA